MLNKLSPGKIKCDKLCHQLVECEKRRRTRVKCLNVCNKMSNICESGERRSNSLMIWKMLNQTLLPRSTAATVKIGLDTNHISIFTKPKCVIRSSTTNVSLISRNERLSRSKTWPIVHTHEASKYMTDCSRTPRTELPSILRMRWSRGTNLVS